MAKNLPANAGDAGDAGLTPELERWWPTPIFLSRKLMDRGAWQATVHGVAKSWTWLSNYMNDWTTLWS